ncbi:DHS-like NAD/FAD-binding domain-containing protein, partial [Infundibulicybe gibba]
MTVFLPLEASAPAPASPAFLVPSLDPVNQLAKLVKTILKAKRIVVICGAGISVQAGIPDFRSPEGLFRTLKRDNPKESLASGKDLFDASVFKSETTTSLFCQMIARLSELSTTAEPTVFHQLLRSLDEKGTLLRVYTQNIDAIEQKCGLSFGVPEFEDKRCKIRPKRQDNLYAASNEPSTSRLLSPPAETPRCIPLHGTLQLMHCQICTHSFPLDDYLPSLASGQPPQCPECTSMEETRQLVGKRARGIGKLRPSVVLYNEAHKDGEGVGEVVQKDLMGSSKGKGRSGADLLLVVGTSLRVPGTKRMVREFAKAVRSRASAPSSKDGSGTGSPTPTPRRSPTSEEEPSMKAVYLNLDFPVPTREWEGVFDAWVQGDAQEFANLLGEELEKESRAKDLAHERRRKREEEIAAAQRAQEAEAAASAKAAKKRKKPPMSSGVSTKRRKTSFPPSPPQSPIDKSSRKIYSSSPTQTRLVLRIPARSRQYISEVCITTPSPSS